jgi:hypothetical protein
MERRQPHGQPKRSDSGSEIARLAFARQVTKRVAVGTAIIDRPPHRTVQAQFAHTAPTLDE